MAGPNIISLSPNTGPVGANVLITGSDFLNLGVPGTISFNGINAPALAYFDNAIIVQVPVGATTGPVSVTTSEGTSNTVTFTVTASATPTIISLTPNTGKVGQSIVIAGTNFGSLQGSSTVTFNGTLGGGPPIVRIIATVTSWSATAISVIVPVGAQTGNVVVTVAGVGSAPATFTVTNPSNGGIAAPIGLLLIPCQQYVTQVVLGFDITNFNDLGLPSRYSWKVEEVIPGRTPSCTRQIITYRDLGVATITTALSGYDQNAGAPVTISETFQIGTVAATQQLCTIERGLSLTAQNLQYSVERDPGDGPVSFTRVRLEGRVEITPYA